MVPDAFKATLMANDINHIASNTLHVGFENVHHRVELTDDRRDGGGIVLCRQIVRVDCQSADDPRSGSLSAAQKRKRYRGAAFPG